MPTLGWERAYRSGDLVRLRARRAWSSRPRRRPGQGRRPADRARRGRRRAARRCAGVGGAAAAVRTTPAGQQDAGRLPRAAAAAASSTATAALARAARASCRPRWCPLLAVVDDTADPDLRQGRPGRAALAAGLGARPRRADARRPDRHRRCWLAELWARVLGTPRRGRAADFFADGGGSLAAAQLVSRAARALPAGHRRRRLREPGARRAGRPARRARPGRRHRRAGARRRARCRVAPRPSSSSCHLALALVTGAALAGLDRRWSSTCSAPGRAARPGSPHVSWWWIVGSAGCCSSARPAGWP